MAYEKYQKILKEDKFFSSWGKEIEELTGKLKEYIYKQYVIKAEVLQRDNFTCQFEDCNYCKNLKYFHKLTKHHVRFKKNGGKDNKNNQVTLCRGSHKAYHRGKASLKINKNDSLPSTISGHTFKLTKEDKVNWKQVKSSMANLRKELKRNGLKNIITWEQIDMLLRWLFLPYEDEE